MMGDDFFFVVAVIVCVCLGGSGVSVTSGSGNPRPGCGCGDVVVVVDEDDSSRGFVPCNGNPGITGVQQEDQELLVQGGTRRRDAGRRRVHGSLPVQVSDCGPDCVRGQRQRRQEDRRVGTTVVAGQRPSSLLSSATSSDMEEDEERSSDNERDTQGCRTMFDGRGVRGKREEGESFVVVVDD